MRGKRTYQMGIVETFAEHETGQESKYPKYRVRLDWMKRSPTLQGKEYIHHRRADVAGDTQKQASFRRLPVMLGLVSSAPTYDAC